MKLLISTLLLLFSIEPATIGYLTWGETYIEMLNNKDIKGLSRISNGNFLAIDHFFYLKENLEKRGHTFKIIRANDFKDVDLIIANNFEFSLLKFKKKTILLTWEPSFIIKTHENFKLLSSFLKVYTWNHKICDGKKFHKLFYNSLIKEPIEEFPFSQKHLVTMINNPNGHKRLEIANFYEKNYPNEFCLYGQRDWETYNLKIFKGYCKDKDETLKNHKFLYCFENWQNNYYYISEKILDCFNNLCVPIYSGSTNITDFIPKETFIDAASFNYDFHAIDEFISSMTEETYNTYILAIKNFIQSENANYFNGNLFNSDLLESILECL
jgi:hypothetical protein